MYLFELVFSVFFRYIPRSGIAGSYGSSIFSFSEEPPYCFPQWLHQFTFPPTVYKGFLFKEPWIFVTCHRQWPLSLISSPTTPFRINSLWYRHAETHLLQHLHPPCLDFLRNHRFLRATYWTLPQSLQGLLLCPGPVVGSPGVLASRDKIETKRPWSSKLLSTLALSLAISLRGNVQDKQRGRERKAETTLGPWLCSRSLRIKSACT